MNDSVPAHDPPKPYVGVTGFTTALEVERALGCFEKQDRLLMVGVLASSKTLRGLPTRYPRRYPKVEDLGTILPDDPRALRLVHFATDDAGTLASQLELLLERGGELLRTRCDGFQLNICWPEVRQVARIRARLAGRLVLQLGPRAQATAGPSTAAVLERLAPYADHITDALLDASGGLGLAFDPTAAVDTLLSIRERWPHLGLGVAGGLSAESMHLAAAVAARVPSLSIDAEGRLRDEADDLRLDEVKRYLEAASRALAAGVRDA